jgi:hypothetical protein
MISGLRETLKWRLKNRLASIDLTGSCDTMQVGTAEKS